METAELVRDHLQKRGIQHPKTVICECLDAQSQCKLINLSDRNVNTQMHADTTPLMIGVSHPHP